MDMTPDINISNNYNQQSHLGESAPKWLHHITCFFDIAFQYNNVLPLPHHPHETIDMIKTGESKEREERVRGILSQLSHLSQLCHPSH